MAKFEFCVRSLTPCIARKPSAWSSRVVSCSTDNWPLGSRDNKVNATWPPRIRNICALVGGIGGDIGGEIYREN